MTEKVLPDESLKWTDHERFIQQYLQSSENTQLFHEMVSEGRRRFPVNLDALRRADKQDLYTQFKNLFSVNDLIRQPVRLLKVMQETLDRLGEQHAESDRGAKKGSMSLLEKQVHYKVCFEGNLGRNYVTPRGLQAQMVNNLVGVQGIVTRMSIVRPKLLKSVHHTPQTGQNNIRTYYDYNDPSESTNLKFNSVVPTKDDQSNPMIMEVGYCEFRDTQTLIIQELPERTPTGQLPRSIEVVLEDDLIDTAKPGDRVTVCGVLKCFPKMSTQGDGTFRSALLALSVKQMNREAEENFITGEDVELIKKISQRENLITYMSNSIAPSIYGHESIKKATLLMLLGGTEKNLQTGTHLRGDINMMMIGDPSTAKSQMLRYIMTIAPLAITTTGRGSSSVGLTAAVRRDPDTGENVLEAGAMVLADGGIVLIDEFDKMNEIDRVAIHEVMEQQTVTIAKAGIHCSLNARCSVIAAANPIYGEYQLDLPPTKNVGLPDSLLSRFDLLFIVRDEKLEALDRKIAERVTKNHRYRGNDDHITNTGEVDSYIISKKMQIKTEQGPYVSFQSNLYSRDQKEQLSQTFLKKYLCYAKREITETELDNESVELITQTWVEMRQEDQKGDKSDRIKALPITIRSLESLIRLASAHAKLRLSRHVTVDDCKVAIQLMNHALDRERDADDDFQQPPPPPPPGNGRSRVKEERHQMDEEVQKKDSNKRQETPSVQKPDQPITRGMRKLKIDEEEQVLMNVQKLGAIQVSEKEKRQVFQAVVQLRDEKANEIMDIDAVWNTLKSIRNCIIQSYDVMLKALIDLEANGKIFIDSSKKEVQLY